MATREDPGSNKSISLGNTSKSNEYDVPIDQVDTFQLSAHQKEKYERAVHLRLAGPEGFRSSLSRRELSAKVIAWWKLEGEEKANLIFSMRERSGGGGMIAASTLLNQFAERDSQEMAKQRREVQVNQKHSKMCTRQSVPWGDARIPYQSQARSDIFLWALRLTARARLMSDV